MSKNSIMFVAAVLLLASSSSAEIVYISDNNTILDPSMSSGITDLKADTSRLEVILLETKQEIMTLNRTMTAVQDANAKEIMDHGDDSLMAMRDDLAVIIDDSTNPIRVVPPIIGFNVAVLAIVVFLWAGFKARSKLVANGTAKRLSDAEAEIAALTVQLELSQAEKPKKGIKFMSKKELDEWNKRKSKAAKHTQKKVGLLGSLLSVIPIVGKKKGGNSNGNGHRENETSGHKDGHVKNVGATSRESIGGDRLSSGQIRQAVLGEGEDNGEVVADAPRPKAQLQSRHGSSRKAAHQSVNNLSKNQLKEMTKAELIDMLKHLEG